MSSRGKVIVTDAGLLIRATSSYTLKFTGIAAKPKTPEVFMPFEKLNYIEVQQPEKASAFDFGGATRLCKLVFADNSEFELSIASGALTQDDLLSVLCAKIDGTTADQALATLKKHLPVGAISDSNRDNLLTQQSRARVRLTKPIEMRPIGPICLSIFAGIGILIAISTLMLRALFY